MEAKTAKPKVTKPSAPKAVAKTVVAKKDVTAKKSSVAASSTLRIVQIRSLFGTLPKQKACLIGLGLRKIQSSAVVQDTPAIRGMIAKVHHLIRIEDSTSCN